MAMTTSLSFPSMFDVARNRVGVLEDNASVVNRVRLLILTERTEKYNSPNFGVGLKKYLWTYNTDNQKAIMQDEIVAQLRLYEPSCDPDETSFTDGLLFTGSQNDTVSDQLNRLEMTVGVQTTFGDKAEVEING